MGYYLGKNMIKYGYVYEQIVDKDVGPFRRSND